MTEIIINHSGQVIMRQHFQQYAKINWNISPVCFIQETPLNKKAALFCSLNFYQIFLEMLRTIEQ